MGFRDLALRGKLISIGVVASACALLLTSVVFLTTTYVTVRRSVQEDVATQAAIVADNAAAALAFGDRPAALETLGALEAKATIDVACLYGADGRLFADFVRTTAVTCPALLPSGASGADGVAEVRQPITVGGKDVGAVYLSGNFDELAVVMRIGALVTIVAFGVGLLVAALIASRLERIISSPVRTLADTATLIARGNDYTLRAAKKSEDEIGRLVDAFNTMVEQVERRDARLSATNEELSRASRLKDEFLAALSHELRTPLNAILGWLQILLKTPLGPDQARRALETVERNARAQARLIEDLLDISRIISGKFHFRSDVVELVGVVQAAIDAVRPAAAARRIEIAQRLEAPPKVVTGDADRLRQVVWNLLSNAVKFSETGGRVEVELAEASGTVSIVVRDRGVGIDPAFLPFVFDRFRQADGSLTRQHGGLGLGLAIAHEIIELHGGSIRAESSGTGLGATFTITLPVQGAAGTRDAAQPAATGVSLHGMHVLVVDDDPDARELARIALSDAGADVTTAVEGRAALAALDGRRFDALVCDIAMPAVDGYDVLRELRLREAGSGRITPAVAVTAYAGESSRRIAEAAGYDLFLAKPYELRDLVAAVARLRAERPIRA